jgi:hypothetical protein
MKRIFYCSGLLLILLIAACKKDKLEDPELAPPIITNTVTETPVDSSNINGTLRIIHILKIENDILVPVDTMVSAEFFEDEPLHTYASVKSVSINGFPLNHNSMHPNDYVTIANVQNIINPTWEVQGSGSIPDFKYSNTTGLPSYPDFKNLPSSVDRTKGLVVPISNLSNHRGYAWVCIIGSNGIMVYANPKDHSAITIKPHDLDSIASGSDVTLEVRMENNKLIGFNNKTFSFYNQVYYRKTITLY